MANHLYKDFLSNRRIYNLNRGYWQRVLAKTGGHASAYKEAFSNGKLFYDGNPIASVYLPELGKSVKIVQEEIENEDVCIGAWTKETSIQDRPVQELVISLELSKESVKLAKQLLEGWLLKGWDKSKVATEIERIL